MEELTQEFLHEVDRYVLACHRLRDWEMSVSRFAQMPEDYLKQQGVDLEEQRSKRDQAHQSKVDAEGLLVQFFLKHAEAR